MRSLTVSAEQVSEYDAFIVDTVGDTRQKSLDHEIYVTVTYRKYEVTSCV